MRCVNVLLCALVVLLASANFAHAQIAYGVNSAQNLFRFDVDSPSVVTVIGAPLSFLPEGIDFRPSSSTLYAIDIGANTTQLYTIDITSGASTPVGAGFPSSGVGYDLTSPNFKYGFDFNPTTLQGDNSMRIRLVNTNNANLRLNSSTGQIAGVDTSLLFGTNSPFVDAAAYINNIATAGGATTLFDMDSRTNVLYTQDPPNAGTLNLVGDFGLSIDALIGIHFDIFTTPDSVDPTIGGDFGFAVFKRPDAPQGGDVPVGSYLLYDINLANGDTTNGAAVGPAATPFDFDGGFAVLPVPEPSTTVLALLGVLGLIGLRRRA